MGSINDLDIALMEFFGSFEDRTRVPALRLPAFAGFAMVRDTAGNSVPATPPFITYPIVRPRFRGQTPVRVSVFDRRLGMPNFRGLTNMIAEQLEERVLEGGMVLSFGDSGLIRLDRAGPNFIEPIPFPDPDAPFIVRCDINLIMTSFTV